MKKGIVGVCMDKYSIWKIIRFNPETYEVQYNNGMQDYLQQEGKEGLAFITEIDAEDSQKAWQIFMDEIPNGFVTGKTAGDYLVIENNTMLKKSVISKLVEV